MGVGDRVAWYRWDDHLTALERFGVIVAENPEQGLTTVRWDDGRTIEVLTSYLEPEAEVRAFLRSRR